MFTIYIREEIEKNTFLSHNSFNKKMLYFILKGNYIWL